MAALWYASEQCRGVTQRTEAVTEPIYASWMPPPSPQRALTISVRVKLCQFLMWLFYRSSQDKSHGQV